MSDSPLTRIQAELDASRHEMDGVHGVLLAGTDGRLVAASLDRGSADATAAVTASALQLARRLADILGPGTLDEVTVRSSDGYVISYAVGPRWVLTLLTVPAANIARIHLASRDLRPRLEAQLTAESAARA